jgi:hyaluronoglucosaminidase
LAAHGDLPPGQEHAVPELGIIEGFYGRPWTWEERAETVGFLAGHGYGFYLYAPKADAYLRRRWTEPHPDEAAGRLSVLAAHCRGYGVRFGVGISPYEIYRAFDDAARTGLASKLGFLDDLGVEDVAILFDDMRGDVPGIAEMQVDIVHWCAWRTGAGRVIVCPSYYSDDPVLDRVFGTRPEGYLETLGRLLDPAIQVFWTGEEVVSRQYTPGHIDRVADQLGRPPFLWDNYPVNDGQRMSQYLHLRGFTGRPTSLDGRIAGHGVNPALQPTLTRIPMLTLPESYALGDAYEYGAAFMRAAVEVAGEALALKLRDDLLTLQDVGLDRLGEREAPLRERYGAEPHPAAREIIDWLDGGYRITDEIVRTQ